MLSLYILIIFFNLPLFSIFIWNWEIPRSWKISSSTIFLYFFLAINVFRLRSLIHASLWSLAEYRLKKLLYQHDPTLYISFFSFQSPSNPFLKLKLLRFSFPTLDKMQLQLNIYSWRTSSWGRQRDLLSGSSEFHRGWRLRATSSAEIFARALINYSINPPGILLARYPGESSLRLQFYHLINGGVSFGWLDSRRGRLLE